MRLMYGENNAISLLLIYEIFIPIVIIVIGALLLKFICRTGWKLAKSEGQNGGVINTLLSKQ